MLQRQDNVSLRCGGLVVRLAVMSRLPGCRHVFIPCEDVATSHLLPCTAENVGRVLFDVSLPSESRYYATSQPCFRCVLRARSVAFSLGSTPLFGVCLLGFFVCD